jgi:uncharacterized Fe-S cluster-containing radical SAM superfamily enzyme
MSDRPEEGEFCYVDLVGDGTYEGEVVSKGRDYVIRLKKNGNVVEAPDSCVWTAPVLAPA